VDRGWGLKRAWAGARGRARGRVRVPSHPGPQWRRAARRALFKPDPGCKINREEENVQLVSLLLHSAYKGKLIEPTGQGDDALALHYQNIITRHGHSFRERTTMYEGIRWQRVEGAHWFNARRIVDEKVSLNAFDLHANTHCTTICILQFLKSWVSR
jgi:hypothetical protein